MFRDSGDNSWKRPAFEFSRAIGFEAIDNGVAKGVVDQCRGG